MTDFDLKIYYIWGNRVLWALPMGPIGPYKGPIGALYRALLSLCGLPYFAFVGAAATVSVLAPTASAPRAPSAEFGST